MHPTVASKREQIAAVCRRFGVRRLEVFGSAARDSDFDPATSDIDFLVDFESDPASARFADWLDLKLALESLLGRHVDLVESRALRNPYVRADIERHKQPVYGA
jgi:predicted nucleotidyltransferase